MAARRTARQFDREMGERCRDAWANGELLVPLTYSETRSMKARVREGLLVSPHPRLFDEPGHWQALPWREKHLYVARTLQTQMPDAVFCAESAAVAYGTYEPSRLLRPVVATSKEAHSRSLPYLERIAIPDETVHVVEGIRVPSVGRVAFDCARRLGFRRGLGVCDATLRRFGLVSDRLQRVFSGMGRARGIESARKCARHANALSENGGESYARAAMIDLGFVESTLQVKVMDPLDGMASYRLDYLWTPCDDTERLLKALAMGTLGAGEAAGCIAGELDGRAKTFDERLRAGRSAQDQLLMERRREVRLTWYGIRIVRFSYWEACDDAYFSRLLDGYGVPRAR
ncbi:hypothetical protein [uncultured Parolsenella sp.]|uniref:hypothetical protein n=1 Tax=uncultured Parolsenella sp. TaxID=2083008 RepID=UPI0027DC97B3|nr:hypothetical protein [uncultured Parolsenella sp.]